MPASNLKVALEHVMPVAVCPAEDWLDSRDCSSKKSIRGKPGTTEMHFHSMVDTVTQVVGLVVEVALLSVHGVPIPNVLLGFSVSAYPPWTSVPPWFPLCLCLLILCFSLPAFYLPVFLPLSSPFILQQVPFSRLCLLNKSSG